MLIRPPSAKSVLHALRGPEPGRTCRLRQAGTFRSFHTHVVLCATCVWKEQRSTILPQAVCGSSG